MSLIFLVIFDGSFNSAAAMPPICRAAQADNLGDPGAHEVVQACTFATMACAFSGHSSGQDAEDRCVEKQLRDAARNSDPNEASTRYIRSHLSGVGSERQQSGSGADHSELINRCADAHSQAGVRVCSQLISVAQSPDDSAAGYFGLGASYMEEKRYDEAIPNLSKALDYIADNESVCEVLDARGWSYLGVAQYDRALDDFNRVIALPGAKQSTLAHSIQGRRTALALLKR
jgi:tetratricopeptide (TPR) repeat protein